MAAADLSAVMDGIAAAVDGSGAVRKSYAWPPRDVVVPSCLVDLPTRIDLGSTFGRGSDELELPVLLLIAQDFTKAARDALSAFIAGGLADVRDAIEGVHAWGSAHVSGAEPTTAVVGGTTYMALKLTVEVMT